MYKTSTDLLYSGDSANVSQLLDSLLTGYDKRIRPNYKGNDNHRENATVYTKHNTNDLILKTCFFYRSACWSRDNYARIQCQLDFWSRYGNASLLCYHVLFALANINTIDLCQILAFFITKALFTYCLVSCLIVRCLFCTIDL